MSINFEIKSAASRATKVDVTWNTPIEEKIRRELSSSIALDGTEGGFISDINKACMSESHWHEFTLEIINWHTYSQITINAERKVSINEKLLRKMMRRLHTVLNKWESYYLEDYPELNVSGSIPE